MSYLAVQQPRLGNRSAAGVSLLELMVALTLGAILMAIGIPSYRYVTNSSRATTEVNALLGDMQFARAEAIKQGLPVTICPLSGSAGSYTCAANSNVWNSGWIIFTDVNQDALFTTGTDTLLRVQGAFSVASDSFTSDNSVYSVTYNREGFATGIPATTNGYITVTLHTSPVNDAWTRCLQIGTFGLVQTERAHTQGCL